MKYQFVRELQQPHIQMLSWVLSNKNPILEAEVIPAFRATTQITFLPIPSPRKLLGDIQHQIEFNVVSALF